MERSNRTSGKKKYLRIRARVRRAINPDNRKRPEPHTEQEINAAADKLKSSRRSLSAEGLDLDPGRVAAALGARLSEIAENVVALRVSPLAMVAEQTGLWPEIQLIEGALNILVSAMDAPDGLDSRCAQLTWELEELSQRLGESGESGTIKEWAPPTRKALKRQRTRAKKARHALYPLVCLLNATSTD